MKTQQIKTIVTVTVLSAAALMAGVSHASDDRGGYGYAAHETHRGGERYRFEDDHRRGGRDSIDARQMRQRMAIREGLRNGSLPPREADGLIREQTPTERLERRLESDGRLTLRERARLQEELDDARRNIQRQVRDDDRRFNNRYGYGYWR